MPTTTDINSFSIPLLGDTANIETAIHPFANAVDALVIPRFATTAARDAAITTPSFGQTAAVSGTGEMYYHNGSAWCGLVPRVKYKNADLSRSSTTVIAADPDLALSVEASSVYLANLFITYTIITSDTQDIKVNCLFPSGAGIFQPWWAETDAGTSGVDTTVRLNRSGSGTEVPFGAQAASHSSAHMQNILITAGTAGTFSLGWAQQASSANATILQARSLLSLLKIG